MSIKFKYRAKKGALFLTGSIDAETEDEALSKLQQQGLTIISINKETDNEEVILRRDTPTQEVKEEEPQEMVVLTSDRKCTPKIEKEEKPPLIDPKTKKIIGYVVGGVFGLACLVLFPFVFLGQSSDGGKDKNVQYKVVKTKVVRAAPSFKDFIIKVESAASKNGIKDVAKKVLAKNKADFKEKERAMFHFFFKSQNVKTEKAVAVLRWNWSGKEEWEYSFSLSRGSIEKKDLQVRKKELHKGKSVKYDIIVPSHIKVSAAKGMVKKEIEKLQNKWEHEVEKIKIDAIYENFDAPFMSCEVDAEPGSYSSRDCRLITKRF